MIKKIDVLVIGAGPGGYPAAIRAAQLGKKVILVEKKYIGGECLNFGCIPSKALITAANYYYKLSKGKGSIMGITVENTRIDFQKLQLWKESVQTKLINGIKQLLKGNNVETIMGEAKFLSQYQVEISIDDGEKIVIESENIIIATGANYNSLPDFKIDEKRILSAKGALELKKIPEELLVIGGGIIGLELGSVYHKLGSKVTIVELMPELLPGVDSSLVRVVKRRLKKDGIEIITEGKSGNLKELKNGKMQVEVISKRKGTKIINADKILLAVGKNANTNALDISKSGVRLDNNGFVVINSKQKTNVSHIYAVGDVTGLPFLAHRATKQGIVAAEVIAGLAAEADFKTIPSAIFTDPEIAFTGMTEQEAKDAGFNVITSRVPFAISGRALSHLSEEGFVKIVAEKNTNVILGVQMVGLEATDLISEAALAIEMGATVEDVGLTVHPHPTLGELLMEASEAALGKAIHVMNPLKKEDKKKIKRR